MKAFLNHLATEMHVAASTQNQAFSALLFLYQEVLKVVRWTIVQRAPSYDGLAIRRALHITRVRPALNLR